MTGSETGNGDRAAPTPHERLEASGFGGLTNESPREAVAAAVESLTEQLTSDGLSQREQLEVITQAIELLTAMGFDEVCALLASPMEDMLSQGKQRRTQAQVLIQLTVAEGVDLWNDGDGTAYMTIDIDGHLENLPIRSRAAAAYLGHLFFEETGGALRGGVVLDATSLLHAQAVYDGDTHPVAVRLGKAQGRLYLDLANDVRQVLEVDEHDWRLTDEAPIRFRRPLGILPLPVPTRNGSVDDLRPFLNIFGERDWKLTVGYLLGALNPDGPCPILVLRGEQGSAKSSFARYVKSLIDPTKALLRSAPRTERDLMISARNSRVLAFDNLSGLPDWLSDAFCRLATGGGLSIRELYTDTDEVIFDARRPVILNGIDTVVGREAQQSHRILAGCDAQGIRVGRSRRKDQSP